ncbi:hypothetical protein LMH73_020255, partial [Vibrio splendidus]
PSPRSLLIMAVIALSTISIAVYQKHKVMSEEEYNKSLVTHIIPIKSEPINGCDDIVITPVLGANNLISLNASCTSTELLGKTPVTLNTSKELATSTNESGQGADIAILRAMNKLYDHGIDQYAITQCDTGLCLNLQVPKNSDLYFYISTEETSHYVDALFSEVRGELAANAKVKFESLKDWNETKDIKRITNKI